MVASAKHKASCLLRLCYSDLVHDKHVLIQFTPNQRKLYEQYTGAVALETKNMGKLRKPRKQIPKLHKNRVAYKARGGVIEVSPERYSRVR